MGGRRYIKKRSSLKTSRCELLPPLIHKITTPVHRPWSKKIHMKFSHHHTTHFFDLSHKCFKNRMYQTIQLVEQWIDTVYGSVILVAQLYFCLWNTNSDTNIWHAGTDTEGNNTSIFIYLLNYLKNLNGANIYACVCERASKLSI